MKFSTVVVALAFGSASAFTISPSATRGVRTWTTRPLRSEAEPVGDDLTPAGDDLSSKITLESLEIDSMIEGTVKGVSDFGAFVDFGGESDGLVHKSQLSDDFVESPAEFVKVGDKVSVRVLKVDLDKSQVSLSMKSKSSGGGGGGGGRGRGGGGADLSKYEAMAPSEFMTGTVKTIATYGAFIELEGGASGLVHISQLAAGRVETVDSVVSQGDEVQVRVLNVRDGKLSLAMSPYVEKTAEEIEAEKSRPRRGGGDDDQFPGGRKPREERVDDIWSDNTEPKWRELMAEAGETMDNVLELKL
eukprot:CAMPEP_0119542902 /NCGR_PEP_ID=MMETSP1344-20130328/53839_1 /TAXON_ID=236787 /ORGANISM="Florenciella parvula, Strain CCMP2471" /LENGTH=302 /DNA_ID=CAMNT_0007587167 /DNA_START=19 /DNA_END=927 /DNA_ORIENTATION=-